MKIDKYLKESGEENLEKSVKKNLNEIQKKLNSYKKVYLSNKKDWEYSHILEKIDRDLNKILGYM